MFGFEERRTSAFVAAKLKEFGFDEVAEGIGGTGIVGTLKRGNGNPTEVGVVSVTELITDGTRNALPGHARILGDARSFRPEISAEIEKQMRVVAEGTASTYNVAAEVICTREFMPLLNDLSLADEAFAAARAVVDQEHVATAREPLTASEDFARFLIHVPGCFVFIGNGEQSAPLHNPLYDFNDELLLRGARFHAAIVHQRLPSI